MIDRPVGLRLHPREIVETAAVLVEDIALAVEIHGKERTNPVFIDRTDPRVIAEPPCICVEQNMGQRHTAQLLLIHIPQLHIVTGDPLLHLTVALLRHAVRIADIVHQIVVIVPPEVWADHGKAQRIKLTEEIPIAVKRVDIGETVAVRSHLPEARFLQLAQIPRLEEFRIVEREFLGIRHDRRLEIQILHDLLCKDRSIAPPILKHEIE